MYKFVWVGAAFSLFLFGKFAAALPLDGESSLIPDAGTGNSMLLAQGTGRLGPRSPQIVIPNNRIILPNIQPVLPNQGQLSSPAIFTSALAFARGSRLWRVSMHGSNFLPRKIGFIDFGGIAFPAIIQGNNLAIADPARVGVLLNGTEVSQAFGQPLSVGDRIEVVALDAGRNPISTPRFVILQESSLGVDEDNDGRDSAQFGGDDCDDSDPARFPGNPEVADFDGHDEDCDETTIATPTTYPNPTGGDRDGDGFIDGRVFNVDQAGRINSGRDCNDANPQIHPFQNEARNGIDDDCDGEVDEGLLN
jgi:hypothetical protein